MRKIYTKIGVIALLLSSLTAYSQQQRISESQIQPVKEKLKQLGQQNPMGMLPIDKLSKEESVLWKNYLKQIQNDKMNPYGITEQDLRVKINKSEVQHLYDRGLQYNQSEAFPTHAYSFEELKLMRVYELQNMSTATPKATTAFDKAYVKNARSTSNPFGTIPLVPPYSISTISTISNVIYADDFADGTLYALDNSSLELVKITEAGAVEVIGSLVNIPVGTTTTGLSWNPVTSTMYATAGGYLYSVNIVTGVAIQIGQTLGMTTPIWLEIDNNGIAYSADIADDSLYSIDLTTGVATLIGALGVDLQYAQEADFNKETNVLYMASYTGGGVGGIYTIDTSTGAATLVGDTTSLNAEFTMFTIEDSLAPAPQVSNNAFTNVVYEPITSITGFGKIPLTPPNVFELIEANSNSFFADDMDSDGNLYAVDNDSKNLVKFYNDGTFRIVGNLTNIVSDHTVTGLSWNPTNSTMYLSSTSGTANNLYTVDLTTGVATGVSSITPSSAIPIWLEIDNNGNAFFADISGDNLYSLNLTTGAGTVVGPLGIDISYAQDADFDKNTNTLYMAGYQASGESGIYTVNTGTGFATFVGTTDGMELGTFTIADTLPDAPPITEYCPLGTPNSAYEYISNVTFAGINNETGGDGSTSYATPTGTVEQGATVPLSVTISPDGSDNLTVYFDWNHDFDFNDEGEKIVLATLTSSPGPFTYDVPVPADAVLGETTMRVVLTWLYDTDPCNDFSYGEVEEYKINVTGETASVSNATKYSIAAYPNPFTDVIRFTDVKGVQSISVTDISGRLIKTLAPSTEINLSSLKAGLYILTLKMEDGTVKSIKAIKK